MQTYLSRAALGDEKTQALVLMCSDRRYRVPTQEFVEDHLGIKSYDIVAMPGGAYMIAFGEALPKQLKVVMRMIRFLMKAHVPPRIVIVSHQDCGRYLEGFASWLWRPGFSLEEKQKRDLQDVRRDLLDEFSGVRVETFYARQDVSGSVSFEAA